LRKNQLLFKAVAKPFLNVILKADSIFTQDDLTFNLLAEEGGKSVVKGGDTRVDRVLEIAQSPYENNPIAVFCEQGPTLMAGSIWEKDFALIAPQIEHPAYRHWFWILAPHDPKEALISTWEKRFGGQTIRYSQLNGGHTSKSRILIVDTVGILKYIYRYSQAAYIGGGFGKSIHNTLEPAAYGLPIAFGPRHHKFPEAEGMINGGGAFCVETEGEFADFMANCETENKRRILGKANLDYIQNQSGATATILPVLSAFLTQKS
jgi:3-deoxy-D-manno-octulosonic-acid transferase